MPHRLHIQPVWVYTRKPARKRARSRMLYALLAVAVVAAGLLWRSGLIPLPQWLSNNGGDALWALMVFVGFGFLLPRASTLIVALLALTFAWGVEFSQLYHAPWIDAIRATIPGKLVLGNTFAGRIWWPMPWALRLERWRSGDGCKLQRNLQSRREVIAQIMDYAAQLQSWTFEDLDAAVKRAELPEGGKPRGLVESFDNLDDFEPLVFMDAITRNLRRGRMLLLVVGDGIREGLESLAGIVQRHPGFHAALGLIELRVYPLPNGGFIGQPRTLLRTMNIERGVVTFNDDRLSITSPPVTTDDVAAGTATKRPASLTEEEYYAFLASKFPDAPAFVRAFVQRLERIGLAPEFKRSLIMRWIGPDGRQHNIMTIRKLGWVQVEAVSWQMKTNAEHVLADAYRQSIADAVGGEINDSKSSKNVFVGSGIMTVEHLQLHEDAVFDAIEQLIQQFQELEQGR
jgi:hypothetical protein